MWYTPEEMCGELMRSAVRRDRSLTREDLAYVVGGVLRAFPAESYTDFAAERLSGEVAKRLALCRLEKLRREVCGPEEDGRRVVAKSSAPSVFIVRKNVVTIKRTAHGYELLARAARSG